MTSLFFLTLLSLTCSSGVLKSQELPVDKEGNILYSSVIHAVEIEGDQLFVFAEQFATKLKVPDSNIEYLEIDAINQVVTARYGFFLINHKGISRNIDARIDCQVKIETKNGKYRYSISQFMLTDYQKDRYGKIKPVKSSTKELEKVIESRKSKKWKYYFAIVDDMIESLNVRMKEEMEMKAETSVDNEIDNDW